MSVSGLSASLNAAITKCNGMCAIADHTEFDAPIPAALSRSVHQSADGRRVANGELPHVHFPRDEIHGRDGLPKPPGTSNQSDQSADYLLLLAYRHIVVVGIIK